MGLRRFVYKWRGFFLFPVSLVLAVILYPLGLIYSMGKCMARGKILESIWEVSEKLFVLALANDKYGNVVCSDLFNDTLIQQGARVRFGLIIQTISAVLGHNQVDETLTGAGKTLVQALDAVDPDHCLNAAKLDRYYNIYEKAA